MKTILLILALAASPAVAGGPIVIEERYDVAEPNNAVLPTIIVGLVLICALACGGGDDAPVVEPPPPCKGC